MIARRSATVFAPASVANVVVGFDLLGFAFGKVGDLVTVKRLDGGSPGQLRMGEMQGCDALPTDIASNCAGAALQAMHEDLGLADSLEISLHKGIPLSSGMGGSAASAVGAVVAANALLEEPLPVERLFAYALAGEAVASGDAHGDNIAPCLHGGMVAALAGDPWRVLELPVPADLYCLIVNPAIELDTRGQRGLLARELPLSMHVQQSAHLAGFISACYEQDLELLARSMHDVVVEPQRSETIPAFAEMKDLAKQRGALAFSIAGSGPSVFAWLRKLEDARTLEEDLLHVLGENQLQARSWIDRLGSDAARVTEVK